MAARAARRVVPHLIGSNATAFEIAVRDKKAQIKKSSQLRVLFLNQLSILKLKRIKQLRAHPHVQVATDYHHPHHAIHIPVPKQFQYSSFHRKLKKAFCEAYK